MLIPENHLVIYATVNVTNKNISDQTKIQFKDHKITFWATEFYHPMQSPAPMGFRLIDIRNESSKFNNYPEHDFIHQKTL